ncbi:Glycosyltransferase, catalytic subunit of cellulose synthase and poly-beta-1,6-N-acetylglucosamine synthase [Candidatus Electrothrix marina]|uniref:Glycosyltransferase, catalytic subunit of cellulose synthase and poly-beta-1,6-N-acetylglucosamine synthase n=1 Tax=Candidatus Electrothrix marina TaxID=1859130 RepID=A0A444JFJ3_9BACT|nr:Glycosyltransferase, catalytic subunit of cellulose synthase and poly-beta-1,6-N-acetylglucosamine synthase [Candidatus Electrothrix marina]
MSLLTLFLFCILVVALVVLRDVFLANRCMERLEHVQPLEGPHQPWVSVIIPACNEEDGIETALTSVLSLDYPNLEIIVLNDRSTDATPRILDRLADQHSRLRVVHITDLPAGWLGKNHALHLGAAQAKGEFLLFTDADVHFAPDTLRRSVARMINNRLDHLCLLFRMSAPNHLLSMLIADSLSALISLLKPWLVSRSDSRYFIGAGGFNMIRRSFYHSFGGHRPIRLCPADDVLLGRMAKASGGRCDCLNGGRFVSVEWYQSVGEMVRGLRKNTFALVDYRLDLLLAGVAAFTCFQILPLWGLFLADGFSCILCGAITAVNFLAMVLAVRAFEMDFRCLCWFPVTPYIKLYIIWHAVSATLIQGGIDWRGTFYSLEELKRHKVSVLPWVKLKKRPGDLS